MEQTFPLINAGDMNATPVELKIGQILSLAKMDAKKLEQQLSAFLGYCLGDREKPYLMTVQQRYYFLLQYLGAQKENDLSVGVNINDYLIAESRPWILQTTVGDMSVRQLNGIEIEALELIAQDVDDWLIGSMALQITLGDELPYIQPLTDRKLAANVIKTRYDQILTFGQERINEIYKEFQIAEQQLSSLLYIGYDCDGVVIYDTKEGENSNPARFQCDSAFYGFSKNLFSALASRSPETTAQRGYEST